MDDTATLLMKMGYDLKRGECPTPDYDYDAWLIWRNMPRSEATDHDDVDASAWEAKFAEDDELWLNMWLEAGFCEWDIEPFHCLAGNVQTAVAWRDAGFRASATSDRDDVYAWGVEHEFSLADAIAWRDAGFGPEDAAAWRDAGIELEEAGRRRHSELPPRRYAGRAVTSRSSSFTTQRS